VIDYEFGFGFDTPSQALDAVVIERPGGRPHMVLQEEDRAVWIIARGGTWVGTVTARLVEGVWQAIEIESC
jgi:hypothetical protein